MENISLILISVFSCFFLTECHVCVHKPPQLDQVKFGVELEPVSHRTERSTTHPLRIDVIYDQSIDDLPSNEPTVIKSLLPQAVQFLSDLLNVKQTPATILLNRQCQGEHYVKLSDGHEYCVGGCRESTVCGPVVIPHQHLQACYACNADQTDCAPVLDGTPPGAGVNDTDFILYVSAVATQDCYGDDMSAHASYCQLEALLDRPIAGYINLCPKHLTTQLKDPYTLQTTIQHEIIHALGFSAALYAFYRDSAGQPFTPRLASGLPEFNASLGLYQWSDRIIQTLTRTDWDVRQGQIQHTVHMMVTPKVVEEARRHFQCPDLEGLEVENHGGTGTEITHFEKRLLANEAMTGTHTHERIFSRLTLAVMEDTGWYAPNYAQADPLHWGMGLGCGFAKKSCKHWMDTRQASGGSIKPYCKTMSGEPYTLTCDVGRAAVALCNLHDYQMDLPTEYQYFNSLPGVAQTDLGHYGGSSVFADYCPFYQQFTYKMGDGSKKGTVCRDPYNYPGTDINIAAETYGAQSVCIDSPLPWTQQQCQSVQTQKSLGAGCYQVVCTSKGVTIVVEGVSYPCSTPGQVLNVSVATPLYLHTGQLVCPVCQDVCGSSCPSAPYNPPQEEPVPGTCPAVGGGVVGICVEMCSSDQDCGGGERCCSNGCGHTCQQVASQIHTAPEVPCSAVRQIWSPAVALVLASSLVSCLLQLISIDWDAPPS